MKQVYLSPVEERYCVARRAVMDAEAGLHSAIAELRPYQDDPAAMRLIRELDKCLGALQTRRSRELAILQGRSA